MLGISLCCEAQFTVPAVPNNISVSGAEQCSEISFFSGAQLLDHANETDMSMYFDVSRHNTILSSLACMLAMKNNAVCRTGVQTSLARRRARHKYLIFTFAAPGRNFPPSSQIASADFQI